MTITIEHEGHKIEVESDQILDSFIGPLDPYQPDGPWRIDLALKSPVKWVEA